MKLFVKLFLLLSFISSLGVAEPNFPKLTGRIVDNASLLSISQEQALTNLLKEHEEKTTNQVVVVTLTSLQGYTIEEYGYQLGRHWGIGQKGKDNGVLLIVAPNERKVRTEVGYGLEGTLTDKIAHDIIQEKILPFFRQNNYSKGIEFGIYNILFALNGEYHTAHQDSQSNRSSASSLSSFFGENITLGFFGIIILSVIVELFLSGESSTTRLKVSLAIATVVGVVAYIVFRHILIAFIAWIFTFIQLISAGSRSGSGWGSSGGYSGGSSFGGFSGGGGSFGGGGASGSW